MINENICGVDDGSRESWSLVISYLPLRTDETLQQGKTARSSMARLCLGLRDPGGWPGFQDSMGQSAQEESMRENRAAFSATAHIGVQRETSP